MRNEIDTLDTFVCYLNNKVSQLKKKLTKGEWIVNTLVLTKVVMQDVRPIALLKAILIMILSTAGKSVFYVNVEII